MVVPPEQSAPATSRVAMVDRMAHLRERVGTGGCSWFRLTLRGRWPETVIQRGQSLGPERPNDHPSPMLEVRAAGRDRTSLIPVCCRDDEIAREISNPFARGPTWFGRSSGGQDVPFRAELRAIDDAGGSAS